MARRKATIDEAPSERPAEIVREVEVVREVPRTTVWVVRELAAPPPLGIYAGEADARAFMETLIGKDGKVRGEFDCAPWTVQGTEG